MTEPQTPNIDQPATKPRPRKHVVTLLLYAFLLATICFVAYQVRLCMVPPAPSKPTVPPVNVGAIRDPQPPFVQPPQSQPGNMSGLVETQPALGAGLTVLESDPGGFAPPEGAKTIFGYEQRSPGQVQQQMEYQYPGELEAAKTYYLDLLKKEGYAFVPERERANPKNPPKNSQDSVNLYFTRDLEHVSLALRKIPGQVKMVRILIVTTNVVSQ